VTDDEGRARLEEAARLYDDAAEELDTAAGHCRVAAQHFRDGVVPRGTAHAWAARGHLLNARARLDEQACMHAERASLPPPEP
jgi:hypothetical protein